MQQGEILNNQVILRKRARKLASMGDQYSDPLFRIVSRVAGINIS